MNTLKFLSLVIFFCLAGVSHAATITRFTPQGPSAGVRQIVVDFDRAAVTFGEAKLPAPVEVLFLRECGRGLGSLAERAQLGV